MAEDPKPKLLSGGNPQIPKGSGDAPVQRYIAAMPGWKHETGRRIDAVISGAVPGVAKAVKWNSPLYGMEDGRWFLSFHCFARYVKVTFFNGAFLVPSPPVTSKHAEVRYLNLHEGRGTRRPVRGMGPTGDPVAGRAPLVAPRQALLEPCPSDPRQQSLRSANGARSRSVPAVDPSRAPRGPLRQRDGQARGGDRTSCQRQP